LLEEWRLPDHAGQDPLRPLYLAGELIDWIDNATDLYDVKKGKGGRSPFEHLEQSLIDFRCAKSPSYGDIKCLMPQKKRVWSLHSPFLRILGWVPAPHQFVGIYALRIADAHGKASRVDEFRDNVLKFANIHKLDSTMLGGDYNALFPKKP